ncbi:MAG: sulfur carrier protein ThiS [Pigmentiphaga sp.]
MTTLTVNGEPFSLSGRTVADLVQALTLSGRRLAVDVNRDIVPESAHAVLVLRDGEVVDSVLAIGGG